METLGVVLKSQAAAALLTLRAYGVNHRLSSLRRQAAFSCMSCAPFTSAEQLQEHIDAFIAAYYEIAAPFAWTEERVYQRRFKIRRITQL